MRIALRIYLNVGLESIKKIGVFHLYFECKVAGKFYTVGKIFPFYSLFPIFGIIMTFLIFGEIPTMLFLIGGIIVISSVFLLHKIR